MRRSQRIEGGGHSRQREQQVQRPEAELCLESCENSAEACGVGAE